MSLVTEQHSMHNPRAVLLWYDFLCPFCYIGQSRNAVRVVTGDIRFLRPPQGGFQRDCQTDPLPIASRREGAG
jgi:hypothetical protein